MLKKIAIGLLLFTFLGCVAAIVARNPFAYVALFLMVIGAIFFGLMLLLNSLAWKLFSKSFEKNHPLKRNRFNVLFFACTLLFYALVGVVDEFCLPGATLLLYLLSKVAAFLFALFLLWSFVRGAKIKVLVTGSLVFVAVFGLLTIANFTREKGDGKKEAGSLEKLKMLGYVDWNSSVADIEKRGVTYHDPELASKGLNLYNFQTLPKAYLIDMKGAILHKWATSVDDCKSFKDHVELFENGDLLVISDEAVLRLDWDSNLKWKVRLRSHHDGYIDGEKQILVLAKEHGLVFWNGIPVPITSDFVAILSPEGEVTGKIHIYDLVKEEIPFEPVARIYGALLKAFKPVNVVRMLTGRISDFMREVVPGFHRDILHTNSIEILDRDIKDFCKKGDWLISVRQIDLVAVVDPQKKKLVWSWGPGKLNWQHHPTLLENGNLLIFDNGIDRGFTRILELNPLTKESVWEYKSNPPEEFFSEYRGGNQRLPNSNTLITESEKGRVFEVTKEGNMVWEFYNPNVKPDQKKRERLYRMMRITPPEAPAIFDLIKKRK